MINPKDTLNLYLDTGDFLISSISNKLNIYFELENARNWTRMIFQIGNINEYVDYVNNIRFWWDRACESFRYKTVINNKIIRRKYTTCEYGVNHWTVEKLINTIQKDMEKIKYEKLIKKRKIALEKDFK